MPSQGTRRQPELRIQFGPEHVPQQLEDRFDEFTVAVAGELNAGTPINYQARRAGLSSWELDEETWQHLVAEARTRTDGRRLALGPHDVIDRLAASVAIWQRATHGFYRYAPLLKAPRPTGFRRRDRVTWQKARCRCTSCKRQPSCWKRSASLSISTA